MVFKLCFVDNYNKLLKLNFVRINMSNLTNNQTIKTQNSKKNLIPHKFYENLKRFVNNKVVMFSVSLGFICFLMSASYVDKEMNFLFYIFNTCLFVSFAAILNSHWFNLLNIETSYRFKDNIFRDVVISCLCIGITIETAFSSSLFTPIFGKVINTIIVFTCYLLVIFAFSMTCHILILKYDVIENNKSEAKSETAESN